MQRIRKALNNQRGVTLIELLAVVVILGIIAAVAAPVVLNQIDDAGTKADEASKAIIADAVQRAMINGETDFDSLPVSKTDLSSDDLGLVPKYLNTLPEPEDDTKSFNVAVDSEGGVTVTIE